MVYAKKQYGQHFLINESICQKIAEAVEELKKEVPNILEVGPGQGVLTKYLLDKNLRLVEIDPRMVEILVRDLKVNPNKITNKDFLKLDVNELFEGEPFVLVGNYPYNISSQIVFKMIENRHQIPFMIGMFQKEVAYRFLASEGNKVYGSISVLMQAFYNGKKLFNVSPGSFNPPPKVDSGVLRLIRKENYNLPCDEKLFFRVVKTAFQQRRKTLRNSLKIFNLSNNIKANGIFDKRPEQLSVSLFIELTSLIENDA